MLTQKFAHATALALELHATQVRKGTQIPYASHRLGVASLVLENGGDEERMRLTSAVLRAAVNGGNLVPIKCFDGNQSGRDCG